MSVVFEILRPLIEFITSFISSVGYIGIFFLMVLESAMIPIPSEIIMPFSGFLVSAGKFGPILVVLAGSLGNLVGSILTYYFGLKVGRSFIIRYGKYIFFKKEHLEFTERLFQNYGDKISFVGRLLPVIRTYVSLPAGIGKTNFTKFVFYTLVGSLIWNSVLTYAGMQLGNNWKNIDKYSIYLDIATICIFIGFSIWLILKFKKSRKKQIS
ncbi:MAG TPA: DedA family protein [Nitrososphaeraceae archaeon]